MIGNIAARHHAKLLKLNETFVHWLSPLDQAGLNYILDRAAYARQVNEAEAVLIGYAHDVDYPNHQNMTWLTAHLEDFFYIDRIIIDGGAQGKGIGQSLYQDVEHYARVHGYDWLACEVNTKPNNPGSHAFHLRQGFKSIGAQDFPEKGKTVRYYAKALK